MEQLARWIPDPEVLIAMQPEELGQHLLYSIKASHNGKAHLSSFDGALFKPGTGGYPRNRLADRTERLGS